MPILKNIAREQVAVSSSAVTLTATTVQTSVDSRQRVIYAEIDVQDNNIYATFDGLTTPSASAGEIWYNGQKYRIWGIKNLLNLKFIRVSSDAVLEVNYWGE